MTNQYPSTLKKTRLIPLRLVLIVPFVLQIVGDVGAEDSRGSHRRGRGGNGQ
jgi:hypothetical protein